MAAGLVSNVFVLPRTPDIVFFTINVYIDSVLLAYIHGMNKGGFVWII